MLSAARPIPTTVVALCASLALVLAGCGSSAERPSSPTTGAHGPTVTLKSLAIMPRVLRVTVGTTVTWVNAEPITHTVTSGEVIGVDKHTGLRRGQKPDGRFDETLKGTGDTLSYTFMHPGTYTYYCNIHFGMNAEVVVTK
jgi:plastocyanin